jgi:uncharacterized RDD family membrane protein YckC
LRRLKEAQNELENRVTGPVTESISEARPAGARDRFLVAQRVAAKLVDLLIVGLMGVVIPIPLIAPVAGFVYSILGDGLSSWGFAGQSVGKRLMGLRVVRQDSGRPIGVREALVRNLPVGVATFFAIIPLWGWIICILVGVPLMLLEILLMLRMEGETRLGDIMAGTRVVTTDKKTNH